jgi:hypothetical protein
MGERIDNMMPPNQSLDGHIRELIVISYLLIVNTYAVSSGG